MKPSPLAIACSLTAAELPARLREIAAIGEAGLVGRDVSPGHAVLHFTRSTALRERLEAIVAAESTCCAFMTFALADDGEQLSLLVSAPDDAQPVLEEFVASFASPSR